MNSAILPRALGLIALTGSLGLNLVPLYAADEAPLDVAVNFQPGGTKGEDAAWLGYILARAHFVDYHHTLYPQTPGTITPTFVEELTARTDAVKVYREMLAKDATLDVPYFDELVRIDDSAFMPEYVWIFLHQSTWTAAPPNLKLAAFNDWRKAHLPDHHALTKGGLRFVAHAASKVID